MCGHIVFVIAIIMLHVGNSCHGMLKVAMEELQRIHSLLLLILVHYLSVRTPSILFSLSHSFAATSSKVTDLMKGLWTALRDSSEFRLRFADRYYLHFKSPKGSHRRENYERIFNELYAIAQPIKQAIFNKVCHFSSTLI